MNKRPIITSEYLSNLVKIVTESDIYKQKQEEATKHILKHFDGNPNFEKVKK